MGVPKFYRWLSERYPQINQIISGVEILPEFDNFYLDMNGIIHACTHPNDNQTANSLTLREMMLAIFRYIDHMVTEIVKPKKILFMAIDGVAPRAKLNQQRARRFRAAQEREESIVKARQKGETVDEANLFDSNCITPGTEFMDQVGKHLRYFIRKKIKEDPLWRNLRVIFSGHEVPGEGEHKIMQFIRDLRADPNYEPNQRHCMYGQDADLIMLGLASHEPHFALLREIVNFNVGGRGRDSARQTVLRQTKNAQFQLLHLSILRQYISLDFAYGCPWSPDPERLMDDFILLTFLVGNDFLPHLPTLDISEHAFDVLIGGYRTLMAEEPGYLVCNGEIADLPRLEKLFNIIGAQEADILKAREEDVKKFNARRRKQRGVVMASEEELEEEEEALQRAFESALQIAMGNEVSGESSEESSAAEDNDNDDDDERAHHHGEMVDWQDVSSGTVVRAGRRRRRKHRGGNGDEGEDTEGEALVNKDYRGRYYYEKFKLVADSDAGRAFLGELLHHYLQGLMWVLAYYIKGCVSWTWYYPYHYGPMLKDMTGIAQLSEGIHFELGQPFLPFQQLLGCLPPASAKLLPRPYQWIMTSDDSPVKEFYPIDFGVDQDGKKNPWEAVVLLDFIDEKRLVAAEAEHCPATKLTRTELGRNVFGAVLTYLYDPGMVETYLSCNPEIGLPDIHCCQSVVSESIPSLAPGRYFKPELVLGTTMPIAGFPSLTILPLNGVRTEFAKVNMFGSDSRYRSLILEVDSPDAESLNQMNAELLLGRVVYVNYPQVHEAKVVAVSTEMEEVRLVEAVDVRSLSQGGAGGGAGSKGAYNADTGSLDAAIASIGKGGGKHAGKKGKGGKAAGAGAGAGADMGVEVEAKPTVVRIPRGAHAAERWCEDAEEEAEKYLKGRGIPGTGGLDIGSIKMRLRVVPLQGLQRDPLTGASRKVYSASAEADIPIQMAIWTPPVLDTRFEETDELPVEQLMPYGAEVIALVGQLAGCKGRVIGPHGPDGANSDESPADETRTTAASGGAVRGSLKDDITGKSKQNAAAAAGERRLVDVELTVYPPEPPFGYSIAHSIKDEFYSSRDLCALLQISPSVLGKLVGAIRVEPGRADLGLNLKRNGFYQLLGYAQRVDPNEGGGNSGDRKVWSGIDTVEVIGMVSEQGGDAIEKAAEVEGSYWQYSARAAALIYDYKTNFPILFAQLEHLPHQPVYSANDLLGNNGDRKLEVIVEWMKAQPYFKLPRTPFTTTSLSREAMAAIERAADVHVSARSGPSSEQAVVRVNGVPVESLLCNAHRSVCDVSLPYNVLEPKLGDRIVNLTCAGVPFGLRGTVVTIHAATKYVEVIFDEEFIGGKGLQGSCSQFRGRLCPWADLLLVSRQNEYREFKKQGGGKGGKNVGAAAATTAASASAVLTPAAAAASLKASSKNLSYAGAAKPAAPPAAAGAGAAKGKQLLSLLKRPPTEAVASPGAASTDKSKALQLLKDKIGMSAAAGKPPSGSSRGDDGSSSGGAVETKAAPDSVVASNGTGKLKLAEAAGFSLDDLQSDISLLPPSDRAALISQNPLLGVISYQALPPILAQQAMTAAAAAAAGAMPGGARGLHFASQPHYSSQSAVTGAGARQGQGQGPRLVLNKSATQRIVKHELRPNGPYDPCGATGGANKGNGGGVPTTGSSGKPIAPPARSITAILTAAKCKPSSTAATASASATASKAKATISSVPSGVDKKKADVSSKTTKIEKTSKPATAGAAGATAVNANQGGSIAPVATTPSPKTTTPASMGTTPAAAATGSVASSVAASGSKSVSSILANAKKAMAEKKQQQQQQLSSKANGETATKKDGGSEGSGASQDSKDKREAVPTAVKEQGTDPAKEKGNKKAKAKREASSDSATAATSTIPASGAGAAPVSIVDMLVKAKSQSNPPSASAPKSQSNPLSASAPTKPPAELPAATASKSITDMLKSAKKASEQTQREKQKHAREGSGEANAYGSQANADAVRAAPDPNGSGPQGMSITDMLVKAKRAAGAGGAGAVEREGKGGDKKKGPQKTAGAGKRPAGQEQCGGRESTATARGAGGGDGAIGKASKPVASAPLIPSKILLSKPKK